MRDFILTIGEIETPVTTIFNPPMTANRIGESLHTHRETADGIANLNRLFPVAKALRHHHANRLQTCPQFEPRQAPRHRHLNGASRLVTSMPRLLGHMPTSRHSREVVRALLIDLLDDRLMQRFMVSFQRQHILDYQPCSKFAGSASRRGRLPAPHLLAGGQSGPPGVHRRGLPAPSTGSCRSAMTSGCCQKEYDRPDGSRAGQLPAGLLPCHAVQHAHKIDPAEHRQQGQARVPAGV